MGGGRGGRRRRRGTREGIQRPAEGISGKKEAVGTGGSSSAAPCRSPALGVRKAVAHVDAVDEMSISPSMVPRRVHDRHPIGLGNGGQVFS